MTAPADRRTSLRTHRWAPWVAAGLAVAPLLVGIVAWSFRHWTPTQDMAVIDLRVRDVFGPDTPLVGPYSRYGWNHPGPFEFWTVALFGLPFGRPAWATLVGHVLLQFTAIAFALRWAARRSRVAVLVAAAFVGVSYAATGSWMVIEPWNPHVAYAWWIAWLVALALWSTGSRELVGPILVMGMVLVQLHVGYVPLVAVGLAVCGWYSWRDARRARHSGVPRSFPAPSKLAVVVSCLLWLPPIVDELIHRPGNLRRMISFFRSGTGSPIGLEAAAGLVGEGFALPPQWAGRASGINSFTGGVDPRSAWWLAVGAALVVLGWWTARGLDAGARQLATLSGALLLSAVVAVSRVTDTPREYLFYFRTPLAAFVWGVMALLVWRRFGAPRIGDARLGARVSIAASALAIVVLGVRVVPLTVAIATSPPHVSRAPGIETTTERFVDAGRQRGLTNGPVLVDFVGSTELGLHGGVFNGLDREGVDVRTGPAEGFQFGYHRATLDGVKDVWYAVEGGPWIAALSALPGATVIAENSPLSADSEQRLRELHLRLGRQLVAAGRGSEVTTLDSPLAGFAFGDVPGVDRSALDELVALNRQLDGRGCRCALIGFPLDRRPDVRPDALFGPP